MPPSDYPGVEVSSLATQLALLMAEKDGIYDVDYVRQRMGRHMGEFSSL